jgi:hypothetical protein
MFSKLFVSHQTTVNENTDEPFSNSCKNCLAVLPQATEKLPVALKAVLEATTAIRMLNRGSKEGLLHPMSLHGNNVVEMRDGRVTITALEITAPLLHGHRNRNRNRKPKVEIMAMALKAETTVRRELLPLGTSNKPLHRRLLVVKLATGMEDILPIHLPHRICKLLLAWVFLPLRQA